MIFKMRISAFLSCPVNWNLWGCAAPYLPPGGRCPSAHTGADEERRYVPYLYALREKGTLGKSVPFDLSAFLRMRCRHSSSTASRSPFPPGEGIVRHSSLQTPIYRAAEESQYAYFLDSSPKGIPHLISHIPYLISAPDLPLLPGTDKNLPPLYPFPRSLSISPLPFPGKTAMLNRKKSPRKRRENP